MIKLIATDMDGTFLRNDMTYDAAKFQALHAKMQAQQRQFVVASGNQYFQLTSFFPAYPDLIYVAENGALIRDAQQVYACHAFDPDVVQTILAKINAIPDLKLLVCGAESAYALTTLDPQHVTHMRRYYHHLAVVDDFASVDDQILKFAISCPPEKTTAIVDQLRTDLAGLAEPTSSGHGDIDVIQLGRNKATGLAELGNILGIELSGMAAFGDGGNDLEMLREVGLGVAMANAQPDVLAVANDQTITNQKQGVLTYLDRLLED
ncbi:Cof-type HAD-IIB family hydrolase [Lactiplantibacillus fabifermentans]|uniref:Hydrolase, had superfamily, cof family n=2 Tax=Lactiplantibacillus fabifermentans TaxID=483011 RepID=A0A0R2NM14_9LACO|nr:Cof-type HAD-IIB family hydrolase [Lactiplantibacillus fabifermentans]ETY75393.1 HAD family hydrolase [Lactiplantibacillus fabifermentans T30PCM01]KRO25069.1 hydrolase, had superfamily, cof family [Lactiplantibacillus fabifermentans DSM 21115]